MEDSRELRRIRDSRECTAEGDDPSPGEAMMSPSLRSRCWCTREYSMGHRIAGMFPCTRRSRALGQCTSS